MFFTINCVLLLRMVLKEFNDVPAIGILGPLIVCIIGDLVALHWILEAFECLR